MAVRGWNRMEQRMGPNGTVAERAVGDEGVQVHQAAVYRCSVCTVWHTGMWACGHVGVECLSLLDTCKPVSHSRASGKCDADADRPNPAEAATASAPSLQ